MRPAFAVFAAIVALSWGSTLAQPAAPDIVLADFEADDYGDWKITGEAFGPGPAQGALPRQMEVSGYLGHGLVNSFHGGDKSTGTLTSPEFKLERTFITFLNQTQHPLHRGGQGQRGFAPATDATMAAWLAQGSSLR